jgi:hypothetical protein
MFRDTMMMMMMMKTSLMMIFWAPQCDSMTLVSAPNVRRGSTPLPIKHQLRREEAVHEDCDWMLAGATSSPPPINFSPAPDESLMGALDCRADGPLRIALLGQNGVGKTSLAIAFAGEMDRTASVDSDGTVVCCALCVVRGPSHSCVSVCVCVRMSFHMSLFVYSMCLIVFEKKMLATVFPFASVWNIVYF